ncbi:MAG: hypothetical protein KDJ19_09420, partial [Hyphomicrobiaceae bacterium]|nr:hypothetical protein [Hyphomicrobiaceae bacterium]
EQGYTGALPFIPAETNGSDLFVAENDLTQLNAGIAGDPLVLQDDDLLALVDVVTDFGDGGVMDYIAFAGMPAATVATYDEQVVIGQPGQNVSYLDALSVANSSNATYVAVEVQNGTTNTIVFADTDGDGNKDVGILLEGVGTGGDAVVDGFAFNNIHDGSLF